MILHDTDRQQFSQNFDGKDVFASYRLQGGVYALVHVEADPGNCAAPARPTASWRCWRSMGGSMG